MSPHPTSSSLGPDLQALTLSSLAHMCRRSTDRFFQRLDYDDRPCLELFRRAVQEQNEPAWEFLVQQYTNLVISWVQRHPYFPKADEEPEYFANRAFDKFWHVFFRSPEKLQKFENVKTLLQYLKLCTNSAVKEYVERQMRPMDIAMSDRPIESIPGQINPIDRLEANISATKIWQHILFVIKNEEERLVAEDYLIYDLKPREIYKRHRDIFSSAGHVSRVKENLLSRLKRDKELARFLTPGD